MALRNSMAQFNSGIDNVIPKTELVQMAMSYARSRMLCAAARLGVADALADEVRSAEATASMNTWSPSHLSSPYSISFVILGAWRANKNLGRSALTGRLSIRIADHLGLGVDRLVNLWRQDLWGRSIIVQKPVSSPQRGFGCYFWRANL